MEATASRDRSGWEAAGWRVDDAGTSVARRFSFSDFATCFAFMRAVAREAEALAHHPDWTQAYGTLDVRLTTHDAGGLTERDVALAARIEALWAETSS